MPTSHTTVRTPGATSRQPKLSPSAKKGQIKGAYMLVQLNLVHHKYFPVCHICIFRYTSGPRSDECESDSENEIADNFDELVFGVKDSEKEVTKKEDKVPKESERTAKQTKVDSIAKNSTAIESESESENGTKTTAAPKITKSRVPILSGGCFIMITWFL